MERQLPTAVNHKIGDTVKIIENYSGHDFNIGEIVEITEILDNHYCAKGKHDYWYVGDAELTTL